jgi:hypothetical protein
MSKLRRPQPEDGGSIVLCNFGILPHHNPEDHGLKMEAARSSKMLVSCCITTWHYNPEDHDLKMEAARSS